MRGLPKDLVESFPILVYKDGMLREDKTCCVCLGEYQNNESLRQLPLCLHSFHLECIDTWLSSHITCPICRVPLKRDVVLGIPLSLTNLEAALRSHSFLDTHDGGSDGPQSSSEEIPSFFESESRPSAIPSGRVNRLLDAITLQRRDSTAIHAQGGGGDFRRVDSRSGGRSWLDAMTVHRRDEAEQSNQDTSALTHHDTFRRDRRVIWVAQPPTTSAGESENSRRNSFSGYRVRNGRHRHVEDEEDDDEMDSRLPAWVLEDVAAERASQSGRHDDDDVYQFQGRDGGRSHHHTLDRDANERNGMELAMAEAQEVQRRHMALRAMGLHNFPDDISMERMSLQHSPSGGGGGGGRDAGTVGRLMETLSLRRRSAGSDEWGDEWDDVRYLERIVKMYEEETRQRSSGRLRKLFSVFNVHNRDRDETSNNLQLNPVRDFELLENSARDFDAFANSVRNPDGVVQLHGVVTDPLQSDIAGSADSPPPPHPPTLESSMSSPSIETENSPRRSIRRFFRTLLRSASG